MKLLLVFVSLLCVLLGVHETVEAQRETKSEAAIKVGVVLGLSGGFAQSAEEMRRGMELAVQETDTWPMNLIYEDDKGMEQKAAVAAVQKLISADKVLVILNWVNTTLPALAPILNRSKVPLIEFWDHSESMLDLSPYIFCSGTSIELAAERVARFVYKGKGIQKVALLTVHDPWSQTVARSFRQQYEALGGRIVHEAEVDPEEKNLRTFILQLKSKAAEGIFAPAFAGSLYTLVRQAYEEGFAGRLFTANGFFESDIPVIGQYAEGVFSSQTLVADQNFAEMYSTKFKRHTTPLGLGYAALAYDGVKILSTAFKNITARSETITSESIRAELASMRYSGITGTAVLSGQAEKVESIVVVKDGRFQKTGFEE